MTVPTRPAFIDAGIGSLDDAGGEGRLCIGGFSSIAMGRGTFGGGRDGGIGSFDVADVGPGLASAGTCRDCVAITVASLAGGLNLVGGGILERAVVGEGRDVLPVTGSLDGVAVSLVPGAAGILILFGFAVNRKMDFGLAAWLAGTGFAKTTGPTPAADARDVRLLGAGRREIRDPLGVVVGHVNETRESDTDERGASEMES